MLDESLRWVIANGQIERAKEIIKNACRWNKKDYNKVIQESGLNDIMADSSDVLIKTDQAKPGETKHDEKQPEVVVKNASLVEIVRHPEIRKVSFILWFLW